jgi:hypothetical protein
MLPKFKQRLLALEQRVSRRLYGNANKMARNLSGTAALYGARATSRPQPTRDAAAAAHQIQSQGYCRIDRHFSAIVISDIRDKYRQLIEDDRFSIGRSNRRAKKSGYVFSRILKDVATDIPDIQQLIDKPILDIVTASYGASTRIAEAYAWRNYSVPDDIDPSMDVFSNRWHFDRIRSDFLKFFILLDDVGPDDGPLHVLSKGRTRDLLRMGYRHRKSYGLPDHVMDDPDHVFRLTGSAGTSMFCQTPFCLHHAGLPSKGHQRDILQINFQVSARRFDDDWLSKLHKPDLGALYRV